MERLRTTGHLYVVLIFSFIVALSTTSPVSAALPVITSGDSPFAAIYETVAPTIVWIEVEGEAPQTSRSVSPWERFFNIPTPDENEQPRPVEGMGSGVIIDRDGYIITNNHVVENADKIVVRIDHDLEYKAEIVGRDPMTDLAVIKLDLGGERLPESRVATLGDSDGLRPGDYAIAIGNPIGMERSITVGVISGLGRYSLPVQGASELVYQNFIQTDAQINPGNSGGALVNINGEVIGINNMYAARFAAIGFAIPVNMAKKVANQLIATGEVKRGFMGVGGEDITADIKDAMDLPSTQGILVSNVTPGFPAEEAGIKHGDVITTLDGEPIRNYNEFLLRVGEHAPGDRITLGVISDGQRKTVTITLADRDDYSPEQTARRGGGSGQYEYAWRGISVVGIDSPLAQRYDLEGADTGVVVVHIDDDSPASDANIEPGDIIIEIEGEKVETVEDFEQVQKQYAQSEKNILIYRMRKLSNGRYVRGYVAIRSE